MPLSAVAVKGAKPGPRAYKLGDSGGLYLFVQPSGQRYWRLAYRWALKQRTMALGVYPDVGLAEARDKRDAIRKIVAAGRDPLVAAREDAEAAMRAAATFRSVAEAWFEKARRDGLAAITLRKQRWLLEFAYPKLGNRPISQITPSEVYRVLHAVELKGLYETARRLRSTCGRVFRFAVAQGQADRDVCADLRGTLTPPTVKHLGAVTTPWEVGDLMLAIDGFAGYGVTQVALRLAPHLFVRPGELRHAEWAEFDVDARVWAIPAEKTKMRRPLHVPLSTQALEIIAGIRPISGRHRYLFPCQGKRDRPMCENTLNLALQRLGYGGGRMTAHGFRSMASTLLNESGNWAPDAIERQLGHVDGNNVRRIYARRILGRARPHDAGLVRPARRFTAPRYRSQDGTCVCDGTAPALRLSQQRRTNCRKLETMGMRSSWSGMSFEELPCPAVCQARSMGKRSWVASMTLTTKTS